MLNIFYIFVWLIISYNQLYLSRSFVVMKSSSTKSQQYKTRECSLYGFLIQHKDAQQNAVDVETPYSKLVQFCTFLVNNGHQKGHQVKFRDTVTMYQQPVLNQNDTPKFGLLITHQKIAFPISEASPIQDGLSDIATAITEDFERAQADLTGCSGVYSQSDSLKLFPDDQIQKYENVTIKICHQLRASSGRNRGQLLTNLMKENEKDSNNQNDVQEYPTFQKPQPDPGLQIFAEGSGFKSQSSKQLIGDEFKFIFNDYPEICSKYPGFAPTATGSSTIRTVKMRIYKMFQEHEIVQPQMNMMLPNNFISDRAGNNTFNMLPPASEPQLIWKEVNLIEELFDEGSSDPVQNEKNNNYQQPHDDNQYHKDNNNSIPQAQAQQSLTDPPSNYVNQQQDPSAGQIYNQGGYPNQGGKNNMQYQQQQQPGYAPQDNYSQPPYPSDSSIFEHERNNQQHFSNNQNDNIGGLQQPYGGNNGQFIEEEKAPEQAQEQSELSKLELYHVELSGMCSDQDQQIYSQMLAEFSTKFSSFVELAPVTFKNFSFKEE